MSALNAPVPIEYAEPFARFLELRGLEHDGWDSARYQMAKREFLATVPLWEVWDSESSNRIGLFYTSEEAGACAVRFCEANFGVPQPKIVRVEFGRRTVVDGTVA